jgi:hypothetical protein
MLGALVITFFIRAFMLWGELWKNYKYLKTKYPVSIWKLPSSNMALLNEEDKRITRRLYWKYALNLIIGMVIIITFSVLVQHFGE